MKHDVFISYSTKDKEVADILCTKIEEHGLKCWIAPRNETAGISYARQILQAISNSTVMLVCFSQNANSSEHVESEIDNAFSAGKVIIPFRIDNCEMSAEMKYYLNKKHWQNGIPVDDQSIQELISSIIANIPERAKEMEMEHSVDNALDMATMLVRDSNDMETAVTYSKDTKISERIEKLKKLYEAACTIENNIRFGVLLKDFISKMTNNDGKISAGDKPGYEILSNAAGEVMLLTKRIDGKPADPRCVHDGGDMALIYKNKEQAFALTELSEEARADLMAVDKILVVEVENDEFVCEYMARMEHHKALENLDGDNRLPAAQLAQNTTVSTDWLSDKERNIMLCIPAMLGLPENCRAIYDGQKMLITKNPTAARIVDITSSDLARMLEERKTIHIVEIYNGAAVARYDSTLYRVSGADWEQLQAGEPAAYVPHPISTDEVSLPGNLLMLAEQIAKNVHEVWAATRLEQGWTYGPERDDTEKKHPCLIPYEQLSEDEKTYDRNTAMETLKLIIKLGFKIE